MFPNEFQIAQQQKDMVRAAEQYHLAKSLREEQPSLWERVRARLTLKTNLPEAQPLPREAAALSR